MFLRPIIIGIYPQDGSIKNNLYDIFIFLIAPLWILYLLKTLFWLYSFLKDKFHTSKKQEIILNCNSDESVKEKESLTLTKLFKK